MRWNENQKTLYIKQSADRVTLYKQLIKIEKHQRLSESHQSEVDENEEQYAKYDHEWSSEKESAW